MAVLGGHGIHPPDRSLALQGPLQALGDRRHCSLPPPGHPEPPRHRRRVYDYHPGGGGLVPVPPGGIVPYEQLIVDRDGAVATVRLNNPAKLNALSDTLTRELVDALGAVKDDPEVRAVVVTGEGRGFCSGADLGGLEQEYRVGGRARPTDLLDDGYAKFVRLIVDSPKPVIAAVNGVAAGAGLSLALACDIRLASAAATFSMAFVRIGLVPDSGASYFLPRIVGAATALELSITGERIDAERALRIR